jgi:hypothetical protein
LITVGLSNKCGINNTSVSHDKQVLNSFSILSL